VIALLMLMLSYWVTSQRFAISGETGLMRKIELVKGYFKPHINAMSDSVLLVNVGYDPILVGATNENGMPIGLERITDRGKLLQLLTELKRRNDHKFILLDVIFPKDINTDADSALFNTIATMDNIVIPRDLEGELADTCLYRKAAVANYFTNYKFVSFAKYPYLVNGQPSLPLKMYEALTHRHIREFGPLAVDGFSIARKSLVLTFDLRCDSAYTADGEKTLYNLGMDLLGSNYVVNGDTIQGQDELYTSPELTRGKYIIIGSFNGGDMHYSYMENQPGPVILFNAYLALLHGHHRVSFWVFMLLYVAFFILSYLILSQQNLSVVIAGNKASKYRVLRLGQQMLSIVVSWIGYSMFLTILCTITYIWMDEVYDIFITATLFQILSMVVNLIYKHKDKHRYA